MDVAGLVAGLLLGGDLAAYAGYWMGRYCSRPERAVVDAAVELREASVELESTLSSEVDGDSDQFVPPRRRTLGVAGGGNRRT